VRLLILGATGPTGRNLLEQALAAGHEVTALVRSPARLTITHARLEVAAGDATDSRALEGSMAGREAVLSALGAGNSLRSQIAGPAVAALIPAMRARSLQRIIFLSAFGVGETLGQASFVQRLVYCTLLRQIFADKEKADAMLRQSGLDWTLVYPTVLTNGARTGSYRAGERLAMTGMPKISRADVASFMLEQLSSAEWVRRTVVISH
jgi:putative NADH-flavin reductase